MRYVQLIAVVDGSGTYSVAKFFTRCGTEDPEKFDVKFLMAGTKMGELGPNLAPKTEVNSMLIATRLFSLIKRVMEHIQFDQLILLSDSKVCLGALHSFHAKMKLYYTERVLEIQETETLAGVGT